MGEQIGPCDVSGSIDMLLSGSQSSIELEAFAIKADADVFQPEFG